MNSNCLQENFLKRFLKITSALQYMYLQLNYASSNVKIDSLIFISFQENYQNAKIYFYSYHFIPLNKTISNQCQLVSSNFIPSRNCFYLKSGFHMIATIAVITEKKKSSAIAAIIAFIWKPLSSDRSDHSDHSDRNDHMETRLKLRIFTNKNTFQ